MAYPNNFGDDDLGTFFEDFGVAVSWSHTVGLVTTTITATGILDAATESHDFSSQRSEVQVGVVSVLLRTELFPGMRKNEPLTVDGVNYYVSQFDKEADGRLSRAHLRYA
jgi:hypothetical protein